jgi:hypothetical protein
MVDPKIDQTPYGVGVVGHWVKPLGVWPPRVAPSPVFFVYKVAGFIGRLGGWCSQVAARRFQRRVAAPRSYTGGCGLR